MRCPNGYKQQPAKSGNCVKNTTVKSKMAKNDVQSRKKRCPNGFRKKSGKCVDKNEETKQTKPIIHISWLMNVNVYDFTTEIKMTDRIFKVFKNQTPSTFAKTNSNDEIISKFGIITVLHHNYTKINNHQIRVEYEVKTEKNIDVYSVENIEEIIWSLMYFAYDTEGKIRLNDTTRKATNYVFESTTTPENIQYQLE